MSTTYEKFLSKTGEDQLHQKLVSMYEENQDANERSGIHLTDLIKPDRYRGRVNFCYRKVILSAHYAASNPELKHPRVAIMERGHDLHTRWQEKFLRAGYVIKLGDVLGIEVAHEIHWKFPDRPLADDDWRLLFSPDLIVDLRDGTGPEIVELKGYNAKHYMELMKTPDVFPETEDAFIQANRYMALVGIHNALIIVECKDNQKFTQWRVKFNPLLEEPFSERVQTVDALDSSFKNENKLPARVCENKKSHLAVECSMCDVCFLSSQQREQYRMKLMVK